MKKNTISRRDFLKGTLASAAAISLFGCASASETTAAPSESTTAAPTEPATSAAVSEATAAAEETTAGEPAPETANPAQTTDDIIWGAPPAPVDSFSFTEEVDCDLIVVGAGTAGMAAAVSAAQSGARVVVLEKMDSGFGMRTYMGAVGSTAQKEAGVEISEKEIVQDLLRYSSYRADARLIRLWAQESGKAMDWYVDIQKEAGMKVWVEADINHNNDFKEYSTCHMFYHPENSELTGTDVMAAKMVEVGCDVRYKTPMVQLIQEESGAVTGVVAQNESGSYLRINAAKGVLLATGGYASNTEMLRALNEKDYLANVMSYTWPGGTGDGIRAAHFAGGEMDITHTAMYFERACTLPGSVGGDYSTPSLWWMGSQPFLQVNNKGERFANESLPYDYDLHQASAQAGRVFISIFDSNWKEDVLAFHTIGCSRIISPEQQEQYPTCGWNVDSIEAATVLPALESGHLVQADTIEELAEKMSMDPAVLSATVNRYNELCRQGEDTDFYKEAYRMRPVAQAPFYAVTVGGQLLCTMDGMHINTDFQVLDAQHNPIPGLYAGGNDSGCFFADCYPELAVGVAAGRSMTFGYLLGKKLAL